VRLLKAPKYVSDVTVKNVSTLTHFYSIHRGLFLNRKDYKNALL